MPWWTLGLVTVALAAQWLPGTADLLVYDRAAVLAGELWRMVTAQLVHFSIAHLLNNLAVLVPAVWYVETRDRRDAGPLFIWAASAIGVALLVGEPRILQFGGASGISLAFIVYACMRGLQESARWRTVCMVLLAIVAAKFAADANGWLVHDWQADAGFVPVMLSHIVGVATGAVFYLWRLDGHPGNYRQQIPVTTSARNE
jgi:rhomboid family GlyGly-CTERM serine protease